MTGATPNRPVTWPLLAFSLFAGASGAFFLWADVVVGGVVTLMCAVVMLFGYARGVVNHQAEKRGRPRPPKKPLQALPRREISRTHVVVCVVIGVAFVAFAVWQVPEGWKAARSDGIKGTFVAEWQDCGRSGCDWQGSFESSDGQTRLADVSFDGELSSDSRAVALATSREAHRVYPPGSWKAFGRSVFGLIWGIALMLLGGALIRLRSAARQREHPDREGPPLAV